MEVDDDNSPSTSAAEPSVSVPNGHTMVLDNNTPIQPVQPIIQPMVPPEVVPTIAPTIPAIPPLPIVHPLAPLPVCPPVLKPSVPQNSELKTSDSDSDHEDEGQTTAGEYEISEESRLVRER
ncbi:hypothetical protein CRYUN_Cryun18bG0078700 [Craigia yunnanensis]